MSPTPADPNARREVLRDLATGALSLALAGGLAITHFSQTGRLHEDFGREPGPALLPELLLTALAIAGAGMLLRGLFLYRRLPPPDSNPDTIDAEPRSIATPLAMVLFLVLFLLALPYLGFGVSAIALGIATAALLARQEQRPPARAALEGALIAAVIYALFRYILSVPLT